jgi:hypothetical protein
LKSTEFKVDLDGGLRVLDLGAARLKGRLPAQAFTLPSENRRVRGSDRD